MKKRLAYLATIVFLFLSACNINAPQQNSSTPTTTATSAIIAITNTPPPGPTVTAEAGDSLCDNDYFPNDDDTAWTYAGNNSSTGSYTRTDTVTDSTDFGFTITTQLTKVTYTQEFLCTDAGLINLDSATGDLVGIFSGPSGTATVKRETKSGLTLPRNFDPLDIWNQYIAWDASGPKASGKGSFNYHFLAQGLEVVTVPYGSFDAMHLNVVIDVELGTFQKTNGTYTTDIWLVKDIGMIKSEGSMDMPGVKFSDSLELVSFDSP